MTVKPPDSDPRHIDDRYAWRDLRRAERGERDARALWLGPLMAVVCVLLVALAAAAIGAR